MVTTRPLPLSAMRVWRADRGLLILVAAFVLLLPLFTPRLYATDSVQYYVYLRSLFFDGDLDFANEYARFHELNPRSGIQSALIDGKADPRTGKLINVAPIGSALLWTPAFVVAHGGVLLARALGSDLPADGYSQPYIWAICFASALYGLLGLLLSYRIARRYAGEWAATTAALVCWLASPLVFYMYISPPWSHTGGLFATALFVWYWLRTRGTRTRGQWLLLGTLAGLMVLVREQLGLFLLLPAGETLAVYWQRLRARRWGDVRRLLLTHTLFLAVFLVTLLPQLATYKVLSDRWGPSTVVIEKLLYGFSDAPAAVDEPTAPEPNDPGGNGFLGSDHFWDTLVDPGASPATGRRFAHGALLWTPFWALGLAGLVLLLRRDRQVAALLLLAFFAQTWVNGAFGTTWHLSGAFGFRRLIEATPLFVLGGALLIERLRLPRPVWAALCALLIVWNVGLIFQWTVLGQTRRELRQGLVWDGMIERQLSAPVEAGQKLRQLLFDRCALVDNCGTGQAGQ